MRGVDPRGDYGEWSMAMGKEGCGIIMASGGGLAAMRFCVGTKVGFVGANKGQGSYSEYVAVSATDSCFSMPTNVPIEDCASFFANLTPPLEYLTLSGKRAVLHSYILQWPVNLGR